MVYPKPGLRNLVSVKPGFRKLVTAKPGFRNLGPKTQISTHKSMRITLGPKTLCYQKCAKHLVNLMLRASVARNVSGTKRCAHKLAFRLCAPIIGAISLAHKSVNLTWRGDGPLIRAKPLVYRQGNKTKEEEEEEEEEKEKKRKLKPRREECCRGQS